MNKREKHWGWGFQDQQPPREQVAEVARLAAERLGFEPQEIEDPVPLDAVELPAARIRPPSALSSLLSDDPYERITHACGKAYRDLVKAFRGRYDWAVDFYEDARKNGAPVSPLALARCYWQMEPPKLVEAKHEFEKALALHEAPGDYLKLCMDAVAQDQKPELAP